MTHRIVAVSVHWGVGRAGGQPIEGPDEDAFTMAAAALERLPWPADLAPISRVDIVGEFSTPAPDDLSEAIGVAPLDVRRHPSGARGLREALADDPGDTNVGPRAIIVLEFGPAEEPPGRSPLRGALALGLADRPGILYLGLGGAPSRPEAGSRTEMLGLADAGQVGIRAPAEIGASLSPTPGSPKREGPSAIYVDFDAAGAGSSAGVSPSPRPQIAALAEALGAPVGTHLTLTAHAGGEPMSLTFLIEHPPSWSGRSSPENDAGRAHESDSANRPSLEPKNVSEGAYLPKATYLSDRPSRWRLAFDQCGACGHETFPIRGRCARCGESAQLVRREYPRAGLAVEATTVVHRGAQPTEFDRQVSATGDYQVVVARAGPSARVTLQLAGPTTPILEIGDRVDAVLRRLLPMEGEWRYGLKAIRATSNGTGPGSRPLLGSARAVQGTIPGR